MQTQLFSKQFLHNNDLISESDTRPAMWMTTMVLSSRQNDKNHWDGRAIPAFHLIPKTPFECHSKWQWPKFYWSDSAIRRNFRLGRHGRAQIKLLWLCKIYFLACLCTGLIWSEIKQLWDTGAKAYISDMWNVADFVTNSLYLATIALRLRAYYDVSELLATPRRQNMTHIQEVILLKSSSRRNPHSIKLIKLPIKESLKHS